MTLVDATCFSCWSPYRRPDTSSSRFCSRRCALLRGQLMKIYSAERTTGGAS